jgi:MATE family multidrug resistance protein
MTSSTSTRSLPWRHRPISEVLRLAWPIAVSLLSFSVMTAVDTLFVGHLGQAALAGVALGGTTTFTLICFGFGLLRSTNITIAQAVGAGKKHAVLAYLGAGLTIAFGLGLITALVGQVVAAFLPALTASANSGHSAATYMRVRVLGAPIMLSTIAMAAARYGTGDSRSPMIAVLTSNAANVVLVAVFSLGLHAGVAGVATATVLSQLVEVFVLARRQRHEGFGLRAWTAADLRILLRMGVPLGIERFFDVGSFGLMVALFARMGDLELAAHQVAHQALLFGFLPAMAIGDATSVLIGQAVGAGNLRIVPRVQRAALCAGFAYGAILSTSYLAFGPLIAAQFSSDPAVIARAVQLLHLGALIVLVVPFYTVAQATLRAIGDVRVASLITVAAAWGCTPVFGALFGFVFGLGAVGGYIGIVTELSLAACAFWWRIRGRGRGGAWLRNVRRFRSELRTASRVEPEAAEVVVARA